MAVSEEYVYWIDVKENSIKRVNKTVGHRPKNISTITKNVGNGKIIIGKSLKLVEWDIQKGKYLSDFFFLVSKINQGCWGVSKDFFITLSRRS